MDRVLASVRIIEDIFPIEGADKIEVAQIGGWEVVVRKNEFKVGDLVRYFEIDSWIPTTLAPFLTKVGQFPKVFNEVEGERLRTVKLRGQLSQGLLLPIEEGEELGDNLTEKLGILKWEAPLDKMVSANTKGNFPSFLLKTDQPRIQNSFRLIYGLPEDTTFEVTEKMDGSSISVYKYQGVFGVCSRNLELKIEDSSTFVDTAKSYNMEELIPEGYAIQGELCGKGIQGNSYSLDKYEIYVYNVFNIEKQKYLSPQEAREFCLQRDFDYVPVRWDSFKKEDLKGAKNILALAEGKSYINPKANREGLVFKANTPHKGKYVSFKAISNAWLLKEK